MSIERGEKEKLDKSAFFISTGGVESRFIISSNCKSRFTFPNLGQISESLPFGVEISYHPAENCSSLDVFLEDSQELSLSNVSDNEYLLQGPIENQNFIEQLPYIAYTLGEKNRQREGLVTVHAAATSIKGKGVLIFGDKGSGKTITAISLCKNGHSLVGNDLVILGLNPDGILCVFEGSKALTIRKPVSDNLALDLPSDSQTEIPYELKRQVSAKDLGIETAEIAPIELIVRVNIHQANRSLEISTFNRNSEILRLRENMARYIRGVTTPICLRNSPWGYFPSMDNKNLSETRDKILQKIFESTFNYLSSNSPIVASNYINQVVDR